MEVGNDRSSLLTQITAQLLSDRRAQPPSVASSGAFNANLANNVRESRPAQQPPLPEENDQRSTGDSSSNRSLVRARGTRSAEDLEVSSVEDLNVARENVARENITNRNAREAPLGRQSQLVEQDVPLGQIVDIRV